MARRISYAQRYEDMHLLRAFGGQANGFCIDIGAGHPVYDDVSSRLPARLAQHHGRAQPLARTTERGGAAARYTHPVAHRGRAGKATYYLVEDFHGLSTTVEGHARAAQSEFGKRSQTMTVPVTTFRALSAQYAPDAIDILRIGVEGAKPKVVTGGHWPRFRPKVIVTEALAPVTWRRPGRHRNRCSRRALSLYLFRQPQSVFRRRGTRHPSPAAHGHAGALSRASRPSPIQAGARGRHAPGPRPRRLLGRRGHGAAAADVLRRDGCSTHQRP